MSPESDFQLIHGYPDSTAEGPWRDCLRKSDLATHYTSPEYFLEPRLAGKRPFAILARRNGRVDCVLTGHHERRAMEAGIAVRPQICVRGGAEPTVFEALRCGLIEEAAGDGLVTLFAWQPLPGFERAGYRIRREEGVIMLDLSAGPAALFKRMSGNRKTNINYAIKHGVAAREADSESDYASFYEVYLFWCGKKKLPPAPFPHWRAGFELRENRRLFLAIVEGRIVAGIVLRFVPGGCIEYAANSSYDEYLRFKPNDLLHWRAIEWACAQGFRQYDMGGAHLYLRKFGGEAVPTYRHRLDRTLLRRHLLRESAEGGLRKVYQRLPEPLKRRLRGGPGPGG